MKTIAFKKRSLKLKLCALSSTYIEYQDWLHVHNYTVRRKRNFEINIMTVSEFDFPTSFDIGQLQIHVYYALYYITFVLLTWHLFHELLVSNTCNIKSVCDCDLDTLHLPNNLIKWRLNLLVRNYVELGRRWINSCYTTL